MKPIHLIKTTLRDKCRDKKWKKYDNIGTEKTGCMSRSVCFYLLYIACTIAIVAVRSPRQEADNHTVPRTARTYIQYLVD